MLKTVYVDAVFDMLVIDLRCWWSIRYIEKRHKDDQKVTNIIFLPPTSSNSWTSKSRQHDVAIKCNITVTPLTFLKKIKPVLWDILFHEFRFHGAI